MKSMQKLGTAALLAVFTLSAVPVAAQSNTLNRTFLTFNSKFELPDLALNAGTYVFKMADTPTRSVVQVWNESESEMLGHWLYVQAYRPDASDKTVVMFRETPENATPSVQYWFYPGERVGQEFIYPADQAERIAARTGQPVRTATGYAWNQGPNPGAAEQARADARRRAETQRRIDASRRAYNAQQAPVTQPQAAAAQPQAFAGTMPAPRAVQQATAQRPTRLPQTASFLPLSGLLGLLTLAGAAGVGILRRRS